jgi:hypothetical protein
MRLLEICCFVFAGIQALAAAFTLADRSYGRQIMRGNLDLPHKNFGYHLAVACLLIFGAITAISVGFYGWYHPPQPKIVEHRIEVPVEKFVSSPCPAVKTGSAVAKGTGTSFAHSGNGDTFSQDSSKSSGKDKPQ